MVHFAGHGRFDARHPERSCWRFSDGDLYAFELRHTLANAAVTPWLVYGSACEGARRRARRRADITMASTAWPARHSVKAWRPTSVRSGGFPRPTRRISRRSSTRHCCCAAPALAKRSRWRAASCAKVVRRRRRVYAGRRERRRGSAGHRPGAVGGLDRHCLYGDPTPTILQRLSPLGNRQSRVDISPVCPGPTATAELQQPEHDSERRLLTLQS